MGVVPLDQLPQWAGTAVGFEIDVQVGFGQLLEELRHGGHRLGAPDPCRGDLCIGQLGDRSTSVGDAIEHVVVEGEQHSVAGQVHIGFEMPITECRGAAESRDGVFQVEVVRMKRPTAMRKCQHGLPITSVQVSPRPGLRASGHRCSMHAHPPILDPNPQAHLGRRTQLASPAEVQNWHSTSDTSGAQCAFGAGSGG